jgi:hypothetical protein
MTAWYERGGVGDEIRDVLDIADTETAVVVMTRLGLSQEEIADVLQKEEAEND